MSNPRMPRPLRSCQRAAAPGLGLLFVLAALGCGGKGVAGSCPDTGACGGELTGVWKGQNVCEFTEPSQPTLAVPVPSALSVPQTPALAGAPPNPTVSGSWCSEFSYLAATGQQMGNKLGNGGSFYSKPFAVETSSAAFLADHSYSITTVAGATAVTHFPRSCLNGYGGNPTCADFSGALNAQMFANVISLTCADASDTGCDCTYELGESGGQSGVFRTEGSTLVLYPNSGAAPQAVDYCVQGSGLSLGGKNGAHLLASGGIRSMTFQKCVDVDCNELVP